MIIITIRIAMTPAIIIMTVIITVIIAILTTTL
jgi:hypothetical protein